MISSRFLSIAWITTAAFPVHELVELYPAVRFHLRENYFQLRGGFKKLYTVNRATGTNPNYLNTPNYSNLKFEFSGIRILRIFEYS